MIIPRQNGKRKMQRQSFHHFNHKKQEDEQRLNNQGGNFQSALSLVQMPSTYPRFLHSMRKLQSNKGERHGGAPFL